MAGKKIRKFNIIRRFTANIWKNRLSRTLLYLSALLIIAALATGIIIYGQGAAASNNAHRLLVEYRQGNADTPSAKRVTPSVSGSSSHSGTQVPTPSPTLQTYEGYGILGTLSIDKISEGLPVISQTSTKALKVSCCYYQGSLPGEEGNMVITGHNYADGSIFGKLSELNKGDTIVLSTRDVVYDYTVYETKVITPDDIAALDAYHGGRTLTLMTCTDHGNKRLLVRCSFTGS